ncbi:hypothetical protein IWW37_006128, partial [Coemansia sp. RSA 2050]
DYFEWLVDSGVADSIRPDGLHMRHALQNELQGVWCYWRIQNVGIASALDPRKSQVFLTKWQRIIQRYPHERQPRRNKAIYGPVTSQ